MTTKTKLADLAQFTGTMSYLRHRVIGGWPLLLTDGAKYVAEEAGAWWLMDMIALRARECLEKAGGFCAITLSVSEDDSARLLITDGNDVTLVREKIPFTDFPHQGIKFFLSAGPGEPVLMLPSEY